jgi:hypothetical protein
MEEPAPYRAYLVRLWPTKRGGAVYCRAAIQSVATGERWTFSDLDEVVAFWRDQVSSLERREQDRPSTE